MGSVKRRSLRDPASLKTKFSIDSTDTDKGFLYLIQDLGCSWWHSRASWTLVAMYEYEHNLSRDRRV